jgi:hypothetical protein
MRFEKRFQKLEHKKLLLLIKRKTILKNSIDKDLAHLPSSGQVYITNRCTIASMVHRELHIRKTMRRMRMILPSGLIQSFPWSSRS